MCVLKGRMPRVPHGHGHHGNDPGEGEKEGRSEREKEEERRGNLLSVKREAAMKHTENDYRVTHLLADKCWLR